MATWQVQQAKTRLSELIEDANTKGPQWITRHGVERGVLLSPKEYRRLVEGQPKQDLVHLLLHEGPKFENGDNPFDNLRDPEDFGREIDL